MTLPETYCDEARKYEDKHEFKKSIELLDKAITKDKNCIRAYLNRGVDKSLLGDYRGAIEDYDRLLKVSPKNTLALLNRGKNRNRLRDYNGAIDDYQRAIDSKGGENVYIDLNPNGPIDASYDCSMEEIRLERGISCYNLGKMRKAFIDMQFCLDKNFHSELALYWRGMIYVYANKKELGRHDLNQSLGLGNAHAAESLKEYCK